LKQPLTGVRRGADCAGLLHSAGLRATAQRHRTLKVFMEADEPLSPEQAWKSMGASGADRATVYRTVRCLCSADILHHAYTVGRMSYYELADRCGDTACHPHFMCRSCGNVTCFDYSEAPRGYGVPAGYVVERQRLTLYGLCPGCMGGA